MAEQLDVGLAVEDGVDVVAAFCGDIAGAGLVVVLASRRYVALARPEVCAARKLAAGALEAAVAAAAVSAINTGRSSFHE